MAGMTTILAMAALISLSFTSLRHGQMAEFARSIFGTQFFLLYAAALIVVPAMAAAAIVHERKQDCYPLILTTLIPPGWIVWSKLIALLSLYAGLYAGVLPFTGIIYFFAGVEPLALLQGALVSFSLALGTASIGLLASASAKDHSRALFHTGLGILSMLILPWAARVMLQMLGLTRMDWLQSIGPFSAYAVVSSGFPDWRPPLAFALYQGCVAFFCLVWARRYVVPRRNDKAVPFLPTIKSLLASKRSTQFVPISDDRNPIAVKDYRASDLSRGLGPWVLGLLGLATGCLGYATTHSFPGMGAPLIEFYLFVIIIPPVMSSLVLKEYEENMFGSLGVTLLTGKDIARGKIAAAHRVLKPLAAGLILGRLLTYGTFALWGVLESGPAGPLGALNPLPLLLSLFELFLCLFVLPRLALVGATASPSTLAATFASYGSVLVFWGLIATMSSMAAFPFAPDGGSGSETAFFLAQRVAKIFLLVIAARIAMENASDKIARNLRAF
jgi:hypothetical protein